MANYTKWYALPDYKGATKDADEYVQAWRKLAEPLERELGLTMEGFDPTFRFRKGNAQGTGSTTLDLPVWFVRELGNKLGYYEPTDKAR